MQGDLIKILLSSIAIFILGLITINLGVEYYIKYVLFSMIMSGTMIITCIRFLEVVTNQNPGEAVAESGEPNVRNEWI